MSTHHRAAKAAAIAALARTASTALATAPAQAEPPYLSMSSSIRMAISDSTRSPRGNFMEQVVYVDGLHFQRATALKHAQLDEDNGTLENIGDAGYDEIYVGARFLDRNGNTISKVESNRITGDF
jgi:hypothetical protein